MKHLKLLGLAAIAALGLMAFVGAGTASATTLCTTTTSSCYPAGTEIHSSLEPGTSATLTDTAGNTIATCTGSTVKGKTSNETGTWVAGSIETLTWENCSQTTDNVSLGSLEIMQTKGDEGEVVGKGSTVTLQIFGVSCYYSTGEGTKLGTITGGEAPTLKITATVSKVPPSSFLCPSTGIWHAAYTVTSPHTVHIKA